jgi:hypothetical protein
VFVTKSGCSGASAWPVVAKKQQGKNYDYSNSDLRNVINIGHDACNVIISRKKERKEIEAYSPSSNYHIPEDCLGSSKKRKRVIANS